MERGFFISGVAGKMAQAKLNMISHNLANANTTGYQAGRVSFATELAKNGSNDPSQVPAAYLKLGAQHIDMKEGGIRTTSNQLDFAIQGNGYFKVQTDSGEVGYTRAGNFRMGGNGELMTQGGLPVLDKNESPITLGVGQITTTKDGAIFVNNEQVAEFGMAQILDPLQAKKTSSTILETAVENTDDIDENMSLHQGMLEISNVNAVLIMTEMVATLRSYQGMMKVVEQYNQLAGQISDKVGQVPG
ncbi:MAG: flagellar hook basal-body protein [Mariprofundaceae bacterium]